MRKVGLLLLQDLKIKVIDDAGDVVLGFHRPLSTSVEHLHMHAFKLPFKSSWM